MQIHDNQTFLIKSIIEANKIKKKYSCVQINLIHKYEAVVWQGPIFVKIMFDKIKSSNITYIVEVKDNIGLILSLINLEIKTLAINRKLNKVFLQKIFSIADKKKTKIFFIEDFKIDEINLGL